MKFIKPLIELGKNDLLTAGGKAANLGAIINAGLPVPEGFCILTNAYQTFIGNNNLEPEIMRILDSGKLDDMENLEKISAEINKLFKKYPIPYEIADEIKSAYYDFKKGETDNECFAAVRSSATVEDLPDLSFAGQQDTYLNIKGEEKLLGAVTDCWASLWSVRAISYRAYNRITQDDILFSCNHSENGSERILGSFVYSQSAHGLSD